MHPLKIAANLTYALSGFAFIAFLTDVIFGIGTLIIPTLIIGYFSLMFALFAHGVHDSLKSIVDALEVRRAAAGSDRQRRAAAGGGGK